MQMTISMLFRLTKMFILKNVYSMFISVEQQYFFRILKSSNRHNIAIQQYIKPRKYFVSVSLFSTAPGPLVFFQNF